MYTGTPSIRREFLSGLFLSTVRDDNSFTGSTKNDIELH